MAELKKTAIEFKKLTLKKIKFIDGRIKPKTTIE